MPFTPCHVLAVVPLRKRLPWLALAIGAMIPDFGYFFPWMPYFYESAHTLERIFTFCLPVGLAVFAFIRATRLGWLNFVPAAWVSAPKSSYPNSPRTWLLATVAILIGALTHLFWDSWTHPYGYFIQKWPDLPYKWFQHGSTLIAGVTLIYLLRKRFGRRLWEFTPAQKRYWLAVGILALILGWIRFASPEHASLSGQRSLFILVTSTIGSAISIVAISSATLAWYEPARGN